MNERIKELAEQADLYARSDNSSMLFENFQKRYTEKLAELIVKECAKQVSATDLEDVEGGDYEVLQAVKRQIETHFGVK